MGNKGGVSVCDDTVKLVDCISDCKNVSVEKKVFEFSENDSGFANDEEKNVEMEDRLCNKVFGTYQALGSHQRVHKSTSTTYVVNVEDYEDKIPINKFSEMKYSCKLAKPKCNDNPVGEEKTEKVIEDVRNRPSVGWPQESSFRQRYRDRCRRVQSAEASVYPTSAVHLILAVQSKMVMLILSLSGLEMNISMSC
ncbi:hypothetical protein DVH24_007054 [Malus domestica]|uniref:C2H2-type domain-containing protein n=1 Tax=Malus domestica TaxID=3750 RepID=A0A498HEA5_MALDO|nr:hypothetical protein DVH24_007054 [Malus domestica]